MVDPAVPTLDVLIVSFNTRALLRDCLSSMGRHSPDPERLRLTVSVLDNASSDGSAEMVESEFPEVRLLRSSVNLGFGAGTNRLCATSTADYLMPLNPDTLWESDIATPHVETLAADPGIAIVGPRLVWPGGRRQPSSQGLPTLAFEIALVLKGTKFSSLPFGLWDADALVREVRQEGLDDAGSTRDTDFLWATCWVLRRNEFEDGRLFDEAFPMYDEDLDLCMRLKRRHRRVVYVPGVSLIHLGGASSTPQSKLALMLGARRRLYRRHRGAVAAGAFVAVIRGVEIAKSLKRRRLAAAVGR